MANYNISATAGGGERSGSVSQPHDHLADLIERFQARQAELAVFPPRIEKAIAYLAINQYNPDYLAEYGPRLSAAQTLQDLERISGPIEADPALRQDLTRLATTVPGLRNEHLQELLRSTPALSDQTLVGDIRALAWNIRLDDDQTTPDILHRIQNIQDRVTPAPKEPLLEPAAAASAPSTSQSQPSRSGDIERELFKQLREAFEEEGIAHELVSYLHADPHPSPEEFTAAHERLSRTVEALDRADQAYDPYREPQTGAQCPTAPQDSPAPKNRRPSPSDTVLNEMLRLTEPQKPPLAPRGSPEEARSGASTSPKVSETTKGEAPAQNLPRHQVVEDPGSFINKYAQNDRDISDGRNLTGEIETAFAQGRTSAEIKDALGDKLYFLTPQDHHAFVDAVAATLGIPSRNETDGDAKFHTWQAERNARLALSSQHIESPAPKSQRAPSAISNREHIEELCAELKNTASMDPAERAKIQEELISALDQEIELKDAINKGISQANSGEPASSPAKGDSPGTPASAPETKPSTSLDGGAREQLEIDAFGPEPAAQQNNGPPHKAPATPAAQGDPQTTPRADSPPKAGPSTPPPVQIPRQTDVAATTQAAPPPEKDTNTPKQEQQAPTRFTFSGSSGTLVNILAAMRTPKPVAPAQANQEQANLLDRSTAYEAKQQLKRDAMALQHAETSGNAAIRALEPINAENSAAQAVLADIQEAVKNNPGGRDEVFSQMKPGGKFAYLREKFDAVLNDNKSFASSYNTAIEALKQYGKAGDAVSSLLSEPKHNEIAKKLERIDKEIAKAGAFLPSPEGGKSALDGLAENFRAALDNIFNKMGKVFRRDQDAKVAPRPSSSPSPGP